MQPNQPIYTDFQPQPMPIQSQQPAPMMQPYQQQPQPYMVQPQPMNIKNIPIQPAYQRQPQPMPVQQQRPQYRGPPNDFRTLFGPRNRCLVTQEVDYLELFTNFEQEHHYKVTFGDKYSVAALEDSNWFGRQFLGAKRPFTMHIRSVEGRREELLTIRRPFCWFLPEIEVIDPRTNNLLGKVTSQCTFCSRDMTVTDARGRQIYTIHGPCCNPWTFHIEQAVGNSGQRRRVGVIRKKWAGFLKEMFTTVENFGVEFPVDASPAEKAILFGATFLIDFMYFEHKEDDDNKRKRQGGGYGQLL